ncbi:hypothetical protein LZ30DRAFT_378514 [Colletotrichum cereale]|nr:hypothetical protein LZ30DRAFT_378514 [Colletotrichum cereale]
MCFKIVYIGSFAETFPPASPSSLIRLLCVQGFLVPTDAFCLRGPECHHAPWPRIPCLATPRQWTGVSHGLSGSAEANLCLASNQEIKTPKNKNKKPLPWLSVALLPTGQRQHDTWLKRGDDTTSQPSGCSSPFTIPCDTDLPLASTGLWGEPVVYS